MESHFSPNSGVWKVQQLLAPDTQTEGKVRFLFILCQLSWTFWLFEPIGGSDLCRHSYHIWLPAACAEELLRVGIDWGLMVIHVNGELVSPGLLCA